MRCSTCLCVPLTLNVALQGYLTKLDLGNLVSAGMLSVNVLFSNDIQVRLYPLSRSLFFGIPTGFGQIVTSRSISLISSLAWKRSWSAC